MIKKWLCYGILFLFACSRFYSQTYQLIGNPVNTTGWSLIPSAVVSGDFIRLTSDQMTQVGGIKLNAPINLKYCKKWTVEFDFRIDGSSTADGLAFWYLANPPTSYSNGSGLGIPSNATGLMVGFDIFDNNDGSAMSKVHLLYGTNNGYQSNIEFNNTPGSSFHSLNLNPIVSFTGPLYKHVEVVGTEDPSNPSRWIINIKINGFTITNQSFGPSGAAVGMTNGYFGFSASTGAYNARHSIKNVKIYTDKVPILKDTVTKTFCAGNETIDLTSFNSEFTSNPNNYTFTYFLQGSSIPITNPSQFQFNTNTTVTLLIKDKSGILCDNNEAKILLTFKNKIPLLKDTFSKIFCNGNATSDLTSMNSEFVANPNNYTFTYFIQGSSVPITNPSNFQFNANTTVTLLIKDKSGALCDNDEAKILLTLKNCLDSDNDGLMDTVDLDDDNDGIPDIIECPGNDIVNNGSFTGNTNGWTLQPGVWLYSGNSVYLTANNINNADISQTLNHLQNTNNFIPLTLTLGAQDGSQAGGSTAKLEIFLNNTLYATIDNGTVRNPSVNNITMTLSNGATSNFVPFSTANINGFTNHTFTLNIPNNSIPDTATLIFRASTAIDDWRLTDISVKAFTCDTDGDGIFNHLDLDSDNDGCFDALEGDEKVLTSQINTNGSISGPVDAQGVPQLVNAGGAADIGGDQGQGVGFSQTAMINTCNDIDNDGIPDYLDLDNDNDGILDEIECPSQFSWTGPISFSANNTVAQGTISGIPYTLTSSQPMIPMPGIYNHSLFPASYGIPNNNPSIANSKVSSNTLTFAQPMIDPVLVFASVGQQGLYVPIKFNIPVQVLWSKNTTIDSSTQLTGNEGFIIVKIPGVHSSITFDYTVAEYYANFTFGAATKNCDTDGDGIPDYLDLDSDNDGCFDSLEGGENVLTSQLNADGSISGPVDAQGVPQLVNPGGAADTGSDQGQGMGSSKDDTINPCQCTDPTITVSSSTLCFGGSVTLTSSEATGNLWSTGETTQSITVTTAGTYTLTYSNGICTPPVASVTITAEADPDLQITGNLILCETANQLTAHANGSGNTYTWSDGTIGNVISVSTPGIYTVTVTTPAGCQYQKSAEVVQGVVPEVNNAALELCSDSATAVFDLTSAQNSISTTTGVTFSFYQNQADALAGNTNTIANPTAYSSGNAVVYVRIISPDACAKIAELQLTVNTTIAPVITASSTTICFGGNVTLTSSQATGNLWSTGETTQSITVTTAGTYTLTYSNGACTAPVASVTITAEADPDLQITGNLILCETANQLTAHANGSGNTYTWSDGTIGNVISVSTPGIYTVTVTTPAGCQYQKSAEVVQGVVPEVNNAALELCSDSATAVFDLTSAQNAISTTTGVTFSFYQNQADALAGNTNTIANPAAYSSGNAVIYVRVISPDACAKIAELQLTVNVKPVPIITASSTVICNNTPITLTSNFATGNLWSTGETTQTITVSAGGIYTLINNNGICTSEPVSITILQDTDPNVQITGNLMFCEGDSTVLTATANGSGITFSWSNAVTGPVNTVTAPGLYTVTATTALGCQYQQSVQVNMDPLIIVTINPPQDVITCLVPEITLDATASVYEPGATFLWTATGGGNIISGADTLTPVVDKGGVYTLTIISATPLGCTKQSSVTVFENTTPPPLTLNASAYTICKGESVTITASGAQTYAWAGLPGTSNIQTFTPDATTTYTVTGTGANGCTTEKSITVIVVPAIVSSLSNIEICEGFKGVLDAGAGPNYTYSWSTGETSQIIYPTLEGVYTVTISNGVCSKVFSATVGYHTVPEIIEINYKNDNLTIIAKNNENTPLEYSIDNGFTWQSSNIFYNVFKNTEYMVRVRNTRISCDALASYYTFFMPNAITPNGDGHNDVIDFSGITKFKNFSGKIFDRYGVEIFIVTKEKPIWDGKFLARVIPTATYWYIVSWEDSISGKPIKMSGWILLKNRN